jgi:hypothetical protein
MAEQWRKIPTTWIANLGAVHWSKVNQAPDAVGFIWAVDQIVGGVPLSVRGLAGVMGWSRRRAAIVHAAAVEWAETTQAPPTKNANLGDVKRSAKRATSGTTNGPQAAPPKVNDSEQLEANPDHNCTTGRTTIAPLHARAIVDTRENRLERDLTIVGFCAAATKPDQPEKPKIDNLAVLWDKMQSIRLRNVKGKRSRLGGRRNQLKLRVSEHGPAALLHAWLWIWESDHQRAQFIRDNGFGVGTFLRAKNLRDYVDLSAEWDPKNTDSPVNIWAAGDDAFDENGNLRAH